MLIGKGERRDALEAFVRGLGLTAHVAFAGYRDRDLPAALASLDAFALLGAGSDESCRAALEAMAAARPVIARDVGALAENKDELGLAHFLEHLAFNGSKNFKAGQLIPFFQSQGVRFGSDVNAHTPYLETVYD